MKRLFTISATVLLLLCASFARAGTVTDVDGNVYQTIIIGDQIWMAENLKATHYRNGDPIGVITDSVAWSELDTAAYCEYGNDPANVDDHGRLYNWFAVADSRDIAPEGWRIPTDSDWIELEVFMGMSQSQADSTHWRGTVEGDRLKEFGAVHWPSPNNGTNERGFTALPSGFCQYYGGYLSLGDSTYYWTKTGYDATEAWYRGLHRDRSTVYRIHGSNRYGFSIRCVKDVEGETVTDIDGNVYQTVSIGSQVWMIDNLKVQRYRNGDSIPNITGNGDWAAQSQGAYCNYQNDINNVVAYGRLYNWFAVNDSRSIAPAGWHVPTDDDWKQLEIHLGMSQQEADAEGHRGDDGGKLKESGVKHWLGPNTGATNESELTALPSGSREEGLCRYLGTDANIWTCTEYDTETAYHRGLHHSIEWGTAITRDRHYKKDGFAVRCVKNMPDCDGDGVPDDVDTDDDNDGVLDASDSDSLNPDICADADADGCDDCAVGTDNFGPQADNLPANDGADTDADGTCDDGDTDDDNDGVLDASDSDSLNPDICADADADGCDDCAVGTDNFGPQADNLPDNDGPDTDADGACDGGDTDDDNDGVLDASDSDSLNPDICADADTDGCDDCAVGADNFGPLPDNLPNNDGPDTDADGTCDAGDADDDNDGVLDASDVDPLNPDVCADVDDDGCDDCAVGTDNFGPQVDNLPNNDGPDTDADGKCDGGDNCPTIVNSDQRNTDGDLRGDVCDNCPSVANNDQTDVDVDLFGAACDCDDTQASVFPGATEVIDDDIDQDCNGYDAITCYWDEDQDGYGRTTVQIATDGKCDTDQKEATLNTDCDDGDPTRYPGAPEIPNDGIDQNCDSLDLCCVDRIGDANGSGEDMPTIGDVSVMIDAKFITGACISEGPSANIRCLGEADANLSGGAYPVCDDITIGDISMLIDCLFITGEPPFVRNDCAQ